MNINELTAKLKAAEETVELQRFKLERQAEDLHQAKSLESIHRDKRYEVERAFSSYKHEADGNVNRLAGEVCRLEDELEAAQSRIIELSQKHEIDPRTHEIIDLKERIAELEARTLTVKMPIAATENGRGYKLKATWAIQEACADAGIKLQIEGE
uniref:hypothetical protein n=1 Tax=Enterobacter sp. TaxID=42895 RepID=UPI00296EEFAF|nr:hypothetical protein [Enterobacter sp.]